MVRRNLENQQLPDVPTEQIRQQWRMVFREHYLERMLQASRDCVGFYQNYKQGFSESPSDLDCHVVPLFYRIRKMLDLSANALRQQITNTEQRRLEKEVKVGFTLKRLFTNLVLGGARRLVTGHADKEAVSDRKKGRARRGNEYVRNH